MLAVGIWLAVVAVTVLVMARHGHSWYAWLILSGVLGPLCWPLAVDTLVRDRRDRTPDVPRHGGLLIAVPPWLESLDPFRPVVETVTVRDAGATLVCVLDAEDASTPAGKEETRGAERRLSGFVEAVASWGLIEGPIDSKVAYGRPPDLLAEVAATGGYAAIVLGPSGTLPHRVLHGNTRARLRRHASVPIISAPPKAATP